MNIGNAMHKQRGSGEDAGFAVDDDLAVTVAI